MGTDYEKRLARHIKALDIAYENIILILEEDVEKKTDKKDGEEKIALKDAQIKTYAEGIKKAVETANYILAEIKVKQDEYDKLGVPDTTPVPVSKEGNTKLSEKLQ